MVTPAIFLAGVLAEAASSLEDDVVTREDPASSSAGGAITFGSTFFSAAGSGRMDFSSSTGSIGNSDSFPAARPLRRRSASVLDSCGLPPSSMWVNGLRAVVLR